MEVAGEPRVGKFLYFWNFPTMEEYYAWQRKQQEEHQAAVRRQQVEYEAALWRQQQDLRWKQRMEEADRLLRGMEEALRPRLVERNNAPPCCRTEDPVTLPRPELKASPELFLRGAMGTAELQPEAYGEASAVELPPEVNMATSELQLEACGDVSAVELLPAEEAVPLPCPAEEAVPLPCPAEEAIPLPCPAEEAVLLPCPAEEAVLPSSAAGGGAQCSNAVGGGAPPVCCPAEASSFSVAARDSFPRGPGPPLEGGCWGSGRSAFGGGFCYATAGRWHCDAASDYTRDTCFGSFASCLDIGLCARV
ncbi:skin secretory protein xP2-like [Ictalurus furcatus]|uniref:skin secretory protein xP2-like n=1 Tax=Ictalurus furcatus TaxID=66913 RepID=UPI00235074EC|nr:skin secretory protein xP2-like [Ictalurus furcatus]XP_053507272.1 skin secretory protein xP2-like [Ictalurus furcatus]